jgi:hypothetical protein
MNSSIRLVALVAVIAAVSAMISSYSATSLLLVTVLLAAGVLVNQFVSSAVTANAGAVPARGWQLAQTFVRETLRFAIGALVIGWMVVSVLWLIGG